MALVGTSSYGLMSLSNQTVDMSDFDAIKISIASPEKVRSWSYGEVTKPETINYRTFKPERDGLFCARIFGPVRDYECLCGKYKRIKYKGIVCEKCGVEVTSSKVRRERMGHIDLAAPVSHIWFLKSLPSRISTLLGLTLKIVERILYFEAYIVTDAKMSPLTEGDVLTEEEYEKLQEEHGFGSFEALMGAEGIRKLLSNLDLEKIKSQLREELVGINSELKREKTVKRLKLVENFLESDNKPEWMVLTVLPVIPPDIRPLVMLDGGRFASSDLNELYRRVINRNNRLKRLIELEAPDIIIRNEKRMLQESVDALLDNGRSGNIVKTANKQPFKSLSDMLKGKQGRFRQNLLGKRVDYSGRSVIVVGPELKLHQCGLPKKMALELFKPFIYSKLELRGLSSSIKISKKMVEAGRPEVWDILAEVIKQHPVLLNRAPTLHRLGIQAFEPVLIEGKAIQLHPLVCKAFNADFDGDQMAVHVPLSIEAQMESRVLIMSTNNILSPGSGKPIIVPTQDMILGLYYMSMERIASDGKPVAHISNLYEMEHALNSKQITLHDQIDYRYESSDVNGDVKYKRVVTTAGRVMLYNMLPEGHAKDDFTIVNKLMTNKEVTKLIDNVYRNSGQKATVMFCDQIMSIGFKKACEAGMSIGKDDMVIPPTKEEHINDSMAKIRKFEKQYRDGLITHGERYNKIVDEWSKCGDLIGKEMMSIISEEKDPLKMNAIYMMANSGARGSESQIRQIGAMRGLMSKPNGEIIETPVLSNFKEGLSVLEYFTSTHGTRKGMSDTALRTASSGYLTRRLVDVAQNCIVTEFDCGCEDGISIEATIDNGRIVTPISTKVLGRTVAEDVKDAKTGEIIIKAGDEVVERHLDEIENASLISIKVRSPLICKTKNGICAKCYGRDLATGDTVSVGEAVGVIAAQSIGEPGTQLTMNTFHIGGVAMRGDTQSSIIAQIDGIAKFNNRKVVINREGKSVVTSRNCEVFVLDDKGAILNHYKIPYGSTVYHDTKGKIIKGEHLAEWDPYNICLIADKDGVIEYTDLIEGSSIKEKIDEATGISTKIIIDWRQNSKKDLKPTINIVAGKTKLDYHLSIGAIVNVVSGDEVKAGDILARIPKESSKHGDITGGLPRVAELFEARKPRNHSIISEIDGVITFEKDYKVKRKMLIIPYDEKQEPVEYMIPKGKHLFVDEGDKVKKGDMLMDGSPVPHDILRILGVGKFARYIVEEVQKVYVMQGEKIDDKHIEIILSMMLKKVEIVDPGDTLLLRGEYVDKDEFEKINAKAKAEKLRTAVCSPVLLGITKASLQTKSFISAASFQETTRILTEASIQGKLDKLEGLKENVIVGRLIPAGTGLLVNDLKNNEGSKISKEDISEVQEVDASLEEEVLENIKDEQEKVISMEMEEDVLEEDAAEEVKAEEESILSETEGEIEGDITE
jgi:DNA-directed RNA polymerase subunit beta'